MTINPLRTREPVEIGERPKPTKAQKTAAWNRENGLCVLCGKPVPPAGPDVEWDHRIPRALSGDDTTANLFAVHVRCHAKKTGGRAGDIAQSAKAKRQSKLGEARVKSSRGFRRPPGVRFDWALRRYVREDPAR